MKKEIGLVIINLKKQDNLDSLLLKKMAKKVKSAGGVKK